MPDDVTSPVDAIEPTGPFPPRFWWLTRLTALFCLLVVAVAGVRWWWGDVAQRRLSAAIEAAQARGEPILVSDYPSKPAPPDETNAAFYLRRAGTALKLTGTQHWALENVDALPPSCLTSSRSSTRCDGRSTGIARCTSTPANSSAGSTRCCGRPCGWTRCG